MTNKDIIELSLKSIQTTFIIVGGIIALAKFSHYVDEQKEQRKTMIIEAVRYYDENTNYDDDFLFEASEAFRLLKKNNNEITEEYIQKTMNIGQKYMSQFSEHTLGLDSAIFMASLSGEQDIVNEYFCSDAHVIWAALGPSIVRYRNILDDHTLYANIEEQLISCEKFTREYLEKYKSEIMSNLK